MFRFVKLKTFLMKSQVFFGPAQFWIGNLMCMQMRIHGFAEFSVCYEHCIAKDLPLHLVPGKMTLLM